MKTALLLSTIWRTGKFNLGLFLIILILATLEPNASKLLRFDRHAIEAGEWWRLFSGHLVHLGWAHTLLNLTGLGLITLIFQRELSFKNDSLALFICFVGTTVGIYYFSPTMNWYVGLSGSLHGYFIYYLIKGYKISPLTTALALIVIGGKVIWEHTPLADTSSSALLIGGAVAVDSHLYGSIVGLITGLVSLFYLSPESHQNKNGSDG